MSKEQDQTPEQQSQDTPQSELSPEAQMMPETLITPPEREAEGAGIAVGIGVGAAVAIVCGLIWAGIAALTGYELGILAWGIGLAVGGTVAGITRQEGVSLAVMASGLAILGIVLGKILSVYLAGPAMVLEEIKKEPLQIEQILINAISEDLSKEGKLSTEEKALVEDTSDEPFTPEEEAMAQAIMVKVNERLAPMSEEEKEEILMKIATQLMNEHIKAIGIGGLLEELLQPMDILWAILAIITAWRMCAPKK